MREVAPRIGLWAWTASGRCFSVLVAVGFHGIIRLSLSRQFHLARGCHGRVARLLLCAYAWIIIGRL